MSAAVRSMSSIFQSRSHASLHLISPQEPASEEWTLNPGQELRFEVSADNSVVITLEHGRCELFGAELAPNVEYTFRMSKLAIFTYQGCTLRLVGTCTHVYKVEETQMSLYLNVHLALETLRTAAAAQGRPGPRVLVVGPMDAGKSTACRILLNYAVRHDRRPTFVDVDVGVGSIAIPGSIGAATIDRVIDGQSGFSSVVPLVYFYGQTSPSNNPKLYHAAISALASHVKRKLDGDPEANASGVIINTCGFTEGIGYQAIVHTANALAIDYALVLGDERLHSELERDLVAKKPEDGRTITVLRLPRSGGSVSRDTHFRQQQRSNAIRSYFYGVQNELYPSRLTFSFADFELFQNGQTHVAPSTALPIGKARKVDETRSMPVKVSPDLAHHVISVSMSEGADGLVDAPSQGFLFVDEVDMNRQRVSVLAPVPTKPSGKKLLFLMGNIKWIDS